MDKLLNEQQGADAGAQDADEVAKLAQGSTVFKGPPYLKIAGGRVRYDRALLEQWVRDQTHYPEEEARRIMEEAPQRIIPFTSAQNRLSQPPLPSSSDPFPLLLVARDFF